MPRDPDCTLCNLGPTAKTTCIWGDGPENPIDGPKVYPFRDLMLVGRDPGEDEDAAGLAFVGRSGMALCKALVGAAIATGVNLRFSTRRTELLQKRIGKLMPAVRQWDVPYRKTIGVTFTNCTKCHTPKNRGPHQKEAVACLPYLQEEIAQVRPNLILCLGNEAANMVVRGKLSHAKNEAHIQVTKDLGQQFWYWAEPPGGMGEIAIIPTWVTFHPSAVLRNPHYRRYFASDIQRALE